MTEVQSLLNESFVQSEKCPVCTVIDNNNIDVTPREKESFDGEKIRNKQDITKYKRIPENKELYTKSFNVSRIKKITLLTFT